MNPQDICQQHDYAAIRWMKSRALANYARCVMFVGIGLASIVAAVSL